MIRRYETENYGYTSSTMASEYLSRSLVLEEGERSALEEFREIVRM